MRKAIIYRGIFPPAMIETVLKYSIKWTDVFSLGKTSVKETLKTENDKRRLVRVIALAEKTCVGFLRSFVKSARRFHRSTNTDCAVFLIYIRPEFRRCTMCLVLAFSEAATGSTRCFPQTQGYHGNSKE
ncbi:uncharacterized protein [Montipora foliosa]|uniref:uncharacterized protein n=1 Tax=Montipora foliosa TaxID=591990 RepID=UPI0035F1F205